MWLINLVLIVGCMAMPVPSDDKATAGTATGVILGSAGLGWMFHAWPNHRERTPPSSRLPTHPEVQSERINYHEAFNGYPDIPFRPHIHERLHP